jgi:acyl-coenzyme A synthetase/AMP-(fatty) acid ligase
MNIVEPILFQARFQPDAPALCVLGKQVVSYAQLRNQMNNVVRRAKSHGLKCGDVVLVAADQPAVEAALILGLAQMGVATMSAGALLPAGVTLDAVIGEAIPTVSAAKHLPLDETWITGEEKQAGAVSFVESADDDICRIVLTSGTTGDPKAVALTHRLVLARVARFEHLFGSRFPTLSRIYMGLGLASSLGYYFLPYVLGKGGTLFFRGGTLENALRMFEVFRVEAMLASPASLAQLLSVYSKNPLTEFCFDTIVSSGGLLPRQLVERLRPRLCSHLVTAYGATETAMSASAPAHRIAHIPGAVGYVTPGARVEIVDDADRSLPANTQGIVRIGSEVAVDRYVKDPAGSAQMFRNGYFYPGDLGSLTPDNVLVISGRLNSILNIGGEKIAADRVEAALTSYEGVRQAAAFTAEAKSGAQELWAAVVCPDKFDAAALRAHVRAQMPAHFVPKHLVNLDELPMSPMGKVILPRLKAIALEKGGA